MTTCSLCAYSFSFVNARIWIFFYSITLDVESWDSSRLWPSPDHCSYNVKLVVLNSLVSVQPKSGNRRERAPATGNPCKLKKRGQSTDHSTPARKGSLEAPWLADDHQRKREAQPQSLRAAHKSRAEPKEVAAETNEAYLSAIPPPSARTAAWASIKATPMPVPISPKSLAGASQKRNPLQHDFQDRILSTLWERRKKVGCQAWDQEPDSWRCSEGAAVKAKITDPITLKNDVAPNIASGARLEGHQEQGDHVHGKTLRYFIRF